MTIIATDYKAMNEALHRQGFFSGRRSATAHPNSDPARHAGCED